MKTFRCYNQMVLILFSILILLFGCKKDEDPKPEACFLYSSASVDSEKDIEIGEEVTFTNCSENAESFVWDFGDGNQSILENPFHEFENTGQYTVKLTSYGSDKNEENIISKQLTVVESVSPVACFTYSSESHDLGEEIQIDEEISFNNCSENAELYLWEFGDGEQTTDKNPSHSYDECGSYVVKVTAYRSDSLEDFTMKTIDVSASTSMTLTTVDTTERILTECEVYLFDNEDDMWNLENEVGYGLTDSNGEILFDNLQPIVYYVFAGKIITDNTLWVAFVYTPELEKGENNEFVITLQYVEVKNSGKFVDYKQNLRENNTDLMLKLPK